MGRELTEQAETVKPTFLLDEINSMTSLIDSTIKKVRKLITELRPEVLDNLGLLAALQWQAEEFQTRTGIDCIFKSDFDEIDLDRDRSTALFRIFQEALTNITRHAKATRVKINVTKSEKNLVLKISDNGIGIPKDKIESPDTFGLLGIKERAVVFGGDFEIKGVKGKGTIVNVKIPIT